MLNLNKSVGKLLSAVQLWKQAKKVVTLTLLSNKVAGIVVKPEQVLKQFPKSVTFTL